MFGDLLERAVELRAKREPFVLATVVAYKRPQSAKPGSKAIITQDGTVHGWVGGGCVQPIVIREAQKVLEQGTPNLVIISPDSTHPGWDGIKEYLMTCQGGGSLEIYLEPMLPRPELIIFGHSPVAQVLAQLGKILDFTVTPLDPFQTNSMNQLHPQSYVVIATMGDGDEEALQAVAGNPASYIGFVASREKSSKLFQSLREKGIAKADLDRIQCPAGLELGAESLPEIAFSVMAQIMQLNRQHQQKAKSQTQKKQIPILQTQEAVDPICGMKVNPATSKYSITHESTTYYFCCLHCKESFEKSPAQYIK
jgi:xanthine dehydrogenase accessory factor